MGGVLIAPADGGTPESLVSRGWFDCQGQTVIAHRVSFCGCNLKRGRFLIFGGNANAGKYEGAVVGKRRSWLVKLLIWHLMALSRLLMFYGSVSFCRSI
jgi:hypothetical protein